jgi:hypothetical protein
LISSKIEPDVNTLPWCSDGTTGHCEASQKESPRRAQSLLDEDSTITEAHAQGSIIATGTAAKPFNIAGAVAVKVRDLDATRTFHTEIR